MVWKVSNRAFQRYQICYKRNHINKVRECQSFTILQNHIKKNVVDIKKNVVDIKKNVVSGIELWLRFFKIKGTVSWTKNVRPRGKSLTSSGMVRLEQISVCNPSAEADSAASWLCLTNGPIKIALLWTRITLIPNLKLVWSITLLTLGQFFLTQG